MKYHLNFQLNSSLSYQCASIVKPTVITCLVMSGLHNGNLVSQLVQEVEFKTKLSARLASPEAFLLDM